MKYNDNTPEYTRFLYLTEQDPYAILRGFREQYRNEGERDKQIVGRIEKEIEKILAPLGKEKLF